jgi:hypothetical protein
MEERKLMVEIPLAVHEKLLDIESRVRVAGELALLGVSEEVVYLAIGTDDFKSAVDKKMKEREELLNRYKEESNGVD